MKNAARIFCALVLISSLAFPQSSEPRTDWTVYLSGGYSSDDLENLKELFSKVSGYSVVLDGGFGNAWYVRTSMLVDTKHLVQAGVSVGYSWLPIGGTYEIGNTVARFDGALRTIGLALLFQATPLRTEYGDFFVDVKPELRYHFLHVDGHMKKDVATSTFIGTADSECRLSGTDWSLGFEVTGGVTIPAGPLSCRLEAGWHLGNVTIEDGSIANSLVNTSRRCTGSIDIDQSGIIVLVSLGWSI